MSLFTLHFLRPYWLLALLPLAWLCWSLWQQYQQGQQWQRVCDSDLLPHLLLDSTVKIKHHYLLLLLAVAWLFAVVALAGPSAQKEAENVYRADLARVIVLDLTRSMETTDLSPDRLTRAKYKILDILKQSTEGQVGLVVFSAEAYVVSPLTQDAATVAAMVPVLSPQIMPVHGVALDAALEKAEQLFQRANVAHGTILLVTDSAVQSRDLAIAKQLQQQGITISVLAVGTEQSATLRDKTLDIPGLEKLAAVGGGRYHLFTSNDDDIVDLLALSPAQQAQLEAKKTDQMAIIWKDQGRWLIFPLLFLALCVFRRGWLSQVLQ